MLQVESIIFDVLSSDPVSPVEGQMWYNSTEKVVKTYQGGSTQTSLAKNNLSAVAAPTVNDDSADGYSIGSRWIDTSGQEEYVCISPALGAAVWKGTTTGGGSGITEAQHKVLRQLIHFIDNGPAEGFASGAYRETLPANYPFPTSVIWYTASDKLHKIVEKTYTWAGSFPTTVVWKMYSAADVLLATVTDTYDYSSNNRLTPKITRTIA